MSIREHDGRFTIDYYFQGRKGKRVRLRLPQRTTLQEAKHIEKELKSRRDNSPLASIGDNINSLYKRFDDYITVHRSPKTAKDMQRAFRVCLLPFFGHMTIRDLTNTTFTLYQKHRKEQGVSNRTINKELAYFSSFARKNSRLSRPAS